MSRSCDETMITNTSHWEFCLCYRGEEFSHWEWRRHASGERLTSAGAFSSLSECVQDAMRHGYTGGGTILPGIVGTSGP